MKKITSICAIVVAALILASCGGTTKLTMGTGGTAGTYYGFGGVLSTQIKEDADLNVTVVSTGGSTANIQGVDDGDYQLATVQSDVMAYAYNGERLFESNGKIDSFSVIGGLYAEGIQLITCDPTLKNVTDLKGKSVSVGDNGSGVYFNALDVLSAAGLSLEDIKPQYQSFGDSTESLKDGKIDAAFVVAGAPTPSITELATTKGAYLVNIAGDVADNLFASCPYYTEYVIPAGTYDGQTEDAYTVMVKATMIVSADLDEDTVYEITKSIYGSADKIVHAKAAELSIENATTGMTAPFHPGAAKYFAEQGVAGL